MQENEDLASPVVRSEATGTNSSGSNLMIREEQLKNDKKRFATKNEIFEKTSNRYFWYMGFIVFIIVAIGLSIGSLAKESTVNNASDANLKSVPQSQITSSDQYGVKVEKYGDIYTVGLDYDDTNVFISRLNVTTPGVAQDNKALIFDDGPSISGILGMSVTNFHAVNGTIDNFTSGDLGASGNFKSGSLATNNIGTGVENSAIIGGDNNHCNGSSAMVGGGVHNYIHTGASFSVVLGGSKNETYGMSSAVIVGHHNIIEKEFSHNSFILGGHHNGVSARNSGILGGSRNGVSGDLSVNIAGKNNTISIGSDHSVIAGGVSNHTTSEMAFVAGGFNNSVQGTSSAIIGGFNNIVSGSKSAIIVGEGNTIPTSLHTVILGGTSHTSNDDNTAIIAGISGSIGGGSSFSVIAGGVSNQISASEMAFVAGGFNNSVTDSGTSSVAIGGYSNGVSGTNCGNIGGYSNTVTGENSGNILGFSNGVNGNNSGNFGGESNTVAANHSVTIGGELNRVDLGADHSVTIGGYANNNQGGTCSAIIAGYTNTISGNNSINLAGYNNGVGSHNGANIAGLHNSVASGDGSITLGGHNNSISSILGYNSIAGGSNNTIFNSEYSFIAGGISNTITTITSNYSGIIGGEYNEINAGTWSGIIGGTSNYISGDHSVILAGVSNQIDSDMSFIAGGNENYVNGTSSAIISSYGSSINPNGGNGGHHNTILSGNNCAIKGGYGSLIVGDNNYLEGDGTAGDEGGSDNFIIGTNNIVTNYKQCFVAGHGMSIRNTSLHGTPLAFGQYNSEDFVGLNHPSPGPKDRAALVQGVGDDDSTRSTGLIVDNNGNILLKHGTSIYIRDTDGPAAGAPALYKAFTIQHPEDEERWLRHGCLEGPEAGVYYRGKDLAPVTVKLPSYATKIASDFTVQITPIGNPRLMSVTEINEKGEFDVVGDGRFHWHVTGKRSEIETEPLKKDINIKSFGPYTWAE